MKFNYQEPTPGFVIAKTWRVIKSCKTKEQIAVAMKFAEQASHWLHDHLEDKGVWSAHRMFFLETIYDQAYKIVLDGQPKSRGGYILD